MITCVYNIYTCTYTNMCIHKTTYTYIHAYDIYIYKIHTQTCVCVCAWVCAHVFYGLLTGRGPVVELGL